MPATTATVDITTAPPQVESTLRRQVATYTGPSAYANGFEDALSPEDVRMGKIFAVLGGIALKGGAGILLFKYDLTDGVFYWFDMAGVEVVNGTPLDEYTAEIEVVGQ
jgi:hypothetical protein